MNSKPGVSHAFMGKVPPHSVEAEVSVLGSVLLRNEVLDEVYEIVRPHDFYIEAHQLAYETMLELQAKKKQIDLITLSDRLRTKGLLDQIGGLQFLSELLDKVVTTVRVSDHAQIVANASLIRNAIGVCLDGLQEGFSWEVEDAHDYVSNIQRRVDEIAEVRERHKPVDLATGIRRTMKNVSEEINSPKSLTGVTTGFYDLDAFTQGLQPSDLVILAGRPSMGKTALALNIAANAAMHSVEHSREHDVPQETVYVVSLEMSTDRLLRRMIASEAQIPGWRLMNPKNLSTSHHEAVLAACARLNGLPIHVDDADHVNVREMAVRARRLNRRNRLQLIIVDYLQIIKPIIRRGERPNRDRELGEMTGVLKGLAKELQVPVLLLSQLNRGNESRQDKRPQLSDLRESGAIEQDADLVAFVHRESYYDEKADERAAEVIIRKHRNGPIGSVMLTFQKELTLFGDSAEATMKREQFSAQEDMGWGDGTPFSQ